MKSSNESGNWGLPDELSELSSAELIAAVGARLRERFDFLRKKQEELSSEILNSSEPKLEENLDVQQRNISSYETDTTKNKLSATKENKGDEKPSFTLGQLIDQFLDEKYIENAINNRTIASTSSLANLKEIVDNLYSGEYYKQLDKKSENLNSKSNHVNKKTITNKAALPPIQLDRRSSPRPSSVINATGKSADHESNRLDTQWRARATPEEVETIETWRTSLGLSKKDANRYAFALAQQTPLDESLLKELGIDLTLNEHPMPKRTQ